MTEEEAKTTRCCGPEGCGRVIRTDVVYDAANVNAIGFTTVRVCIGSACMAWRSYLVAHEILPVGETPQREGMSPVGGRIKSPRGDVQEWSRHDVFCGLAGKS